MAGGDIQANAETAVSVENGFFRMSGGRITGNAVGVAVSRLDTVSGGFVLSGGTISGCGEAGVSVSEKGAFIMLGGEVQGNPDAVGVALNGGNFDMAGGTITGNGLGVSVRNGSFSQYDGEVTRNTDCDVDVFSPVEGEETGPRFGIVGSAETGSVRLAAGAVIHIDDVLDPDMKTITVNTGSGLGSVITEGLPLRGDVSLFACEGDQYVIGLSDGEAALAYGVFFNTDGGTQIAPQYILTAGQKAQMPEQIPLLNRALFVAWYLGDSEFDFDSVITGSVTLRAAWERVELGAADFRLPAALTVIEEEAFSGLSGKTVVLPAVPAGEGSADSVIRANAFADCTDLVVLVPAGWQIEPGAFAGCEGVLLCGPEGGAAHVYAEASPESCIFCLYS
jgi:hypothetical protein